MSESATLEDIRKAFLQRAKSAHPDVVGAGAGQRGGGRPGLGSGEMVQINLCYEALTRRRKEYDASKGKERAAEGPKAEANGARDAWWRSQGGFDDFQDPL